MLCKKSPPPRSHNNEHSLSSSSSQIGGHARHDDNHISCLEQVLWNLRFHHRGLFFQSSRNWRIWSRGNRFSHRRYNQRTSGKSYKTSKTLSLIISCIWKYQPQRKWRNVMQYKLNKAKGPLKVLLKFLPIGSTPVYS